MSQATALQLVRSSLPPKLRHQVRSARELGNTRERETSRELFSTPLAALNRLLDGGVGRGELVELVGRRSCGSFSTLLAVLAAVTRSGHVAALVDLGDAFSPDSARAADVRSDRVLWLRPPGLRKALAAAEILISDGFPFVALDLGASDVASTGKQAAWLRLARTARARRTALLVVTPRRASGTAADRVIEMRSEDALWDRSRRGVPLLRGIHAELVRAKSPGASGDRETLAFHMDSPWAGHELPRAGLPSRSLRPRLRAATG